MTYFGDPVPIEICQLSGKPCYDKKAARSAKNKRWKQDHVRLRIYQCHGCNYWHLTKNV